MPMLSEGDKSFGDTIMGDDGIMGLGDDGGIMGLNGDDSVMGSMGSSIMGEEMEGFGASDNAEVAVRVMDASGKVAANVPLVWKINVASTQGSSDAFQQSVEGAGKTDAAGILRMAIPSRSSYDSFVPFPALVSIASAADPKTAILADRPILASMAPAAPVNITMAAGGGLAPYIPPGGNYRAQAGMLETLLPYALVAGGAALVWFYVIPWAKRKLA